MIRSWWSQRTQPTSLALSGLTWSLGPLVAVTPSFPATDHPAILLAGTAYRYAVSWTGRDRRSPVFPVLLQPDPDRLAHTELMAVVCATGRVGQLTWEESAGWRELAEREASDGRVIGGWMVLSHTRSRDYQVKRLWLTAPLQYPRAGPSVDLTAIRWPTHTRRQELVHTVRTFPSAESPYFPDPDVLRWELLKSVGDPSRYRRRSRQRAYADGLWFAARGHGLRHPPTINRTERRLWFFLRQMPLPFLWIPQVPIGTRRMDLHCPHLKICVEIDGASHDTAKAKADDSLRDEELKQMGITTRRVAAGDVDTDPAGVANRLARTLARRKEAQVLRDWTCRPLRPATRLPPSLAYLTPHDPSSRARRTV
ncbi:MAG: endonuclease domain-containing protein [Frankia sp.]